MVGRHAALLRADAFHAICVRDMRGDRADAEDVVTGRIFINYRRGDDQAAAGRLYDQLLQHFDRAGRFLLLHSAKAHALRRKRLLSRRAWPAMDTLHSRHTSAPEGSV